MSGGLQKWVTESSTTFTRLDTGQIMVEMTPPIAIDENSVCINRVPDGPRKLVFRINQPPDGWILTQTGKAVIPYLAMEHKGIEGSISEKLILQPCSSLTQGAYETVAEAVELDCSPAEEASLFGSLPVAPRRLRAGTRLMLYVDDASALLAHIRQHDRGSHRTCIVRPTNLEDVFLSLTGTRLEGTA